MNVDYEPQLPKDARVRLRKTVDPKVYGDWACVGNEGWIRNHRADQFGYPEAYIEWDKNHWAYNGVRDGWTFEEHFELVEEMAAKKKTPKNKDEILAAIASLFDDEEEEVEEEEERPKRKPKNAKGRKTAERLQAALEQEEEDDGPSDEEYKTYVRATSDLLEEADGFIVVGVDRQMHPSAEDGILVPFIRGISKHPESEIMITSRMAFIAAQAHQELGIAQIVHMQEEE